MDIIGNKKLIKNLIVAMLFIFTTNTCFAGGIGYINYEKVAANYKYAHKTMQEIEAKSREIQQYLKAKEVEFSKLESPIQKKKFEETVQAELKNKEAAFNEFREKREDDVYNRIHAVAEKIRLEKGFDALFDARSIFSGGTDITNELIQKLNMNSVR